MFEFFSSQPRTQLVAINFTVVLASVWVVVLHNSAPIAASSDVCTPTGNAEVELVVSTRAEPHCGARSEKNIEDYCLLCVTETCEFKESWEGYGGIYDE